MAFAMISKAPARRPQVRSKAQRPRRGRTGFATPAAVTPVGPGPVIQPKLTVGAPNDRFEREADRVADQVMRMPEPAHTGPIDSGGQAKTEGIQRKCSECEEEVRRQPIAEAENLRMKRAPGAAPEIGPVMQARLGGLRGSGRPLPPSTRGFFEPRFGYDFSQVRVHTGDPSANLARSINARAFTVGRDIVFGEGEYAPEKGTGRKLLAHELTHTVQQASPGSLATAKLQRTIGDGHDLTSPRFAGDPELEGVFDDERLLAIGSRGQAVEKVQQALIDAGFPLPQFGPDGIFGQETKRALEDFQRASGLTGRDVDGIVGPVTMGLLDGRFTGTTPPQLTPPTTPPVPTTPPGTPPPPPPPQKEHRFTFGCGDKSFNIVLRQTCGSPAAGFNPSHFVLIEQETRDALGKICNQDGSNCISASLRQRLQDGLQKAGGLDIRCNQFLFDCAFGASDAAEITIDAKSFPPLPQGHRKSDADCQPMRSVILHEIIHVILGEAGEALPDSCENSCYGITGRTAGPELCRDEPT